MKTAILFSLLFISQISSGQMSTDIAVQKEKEGIEKPGKAAIILSGVVYAFGVNMALQNKAQSSSNQAFFPVLNTTMAISGALLFYGSITMIKNENATRSKRIKS